MATMNISLPEAMRKWVDSRIHCGTYANNSDYIRDLIRKDKQQTEKIQALQAAIDKGLASGISGNFDIAQLQQELDNH